MDTLLTLGFGQFHAVDLVFRVAAVLVAMTAVLMGLSTMCVGRRLRFPLFLASVTLLGSAWFESGIARAWQGAFELAGSSYCVTGMPLAGEDRVIAWAFGVPALLFCFGLVQLDHESRNFRHLWVTTLLMALFGPFVFMATVLGMLYCGSLFSGFVLRPIPATSRLMIIANRIGLAAMLSGLALVMLGRIHGLPLGHTAESMLVRGEIIRALSDVLALVIPALALLTVVLNLPEKE
jgi:hypothetical protein